MYKALFFIGFLFVLALTACSDAQVKQVIGNTLPASTGDIDEVVLLIDEALWKNAPGDSLRAILQRDFLILPQSEPMFDLRTIYSMKGFGSMLQRSGVVLIVADMSNTGSDITQAVQEQLNRFSEEGKPAPAFFARQNVWATPQRVVYVQGSSAQDVAQLVSKNSIGLIKQLYEIGNLKAYNNAYAAKINDGLIATLAQKYKIEVQIPNMFQPAVEADNFIWLRADNQATEEVQNLMFYAEPYTTAPALTEELAVALRNKMGKNVSTQIAGSYMVSDTTLGFISKTVILPSGNEALEVRGLWRMQGDFMGGPFVTYCINDATNRRIVVADAFVYAPKIDKRRIVRRMERIVETIKVGGL